MHRHPGFAAIGLFAAILVVASAAAGDAPERLPLAAADVPASHVDWYGLYVQQKKLGWVRAEFVKGADVCATAFTMHMDMTSMGRSVQIDDSSRSEFDPAPPFALRGGHSEMKQPGSVKVVDLTRTKDGFTAKSVQGGQESAPPVPAIDYTLADALSSELWFKSPRKVGDTLRSRSFSIDELSSDVDTVTVTARKETVVEGVRTVFYEATSSSDRRGVEGTGRFDDHGRMLSMVIGGMFEARLEPEDVAKKLDAGGDLFVFGMAKLDKPIGGANTVERLVMEVDGEGAKTLKDGPRQSVATDPATGTVTVSVGAGVGKDGPVAQKDADDALTETVDLPIRLPQVVALAAQAVGDAKTPREKVERLVHFVSDYVVDAVSPGQLTVAEVITAKKGDCNDHARLFAALARAAGVPAREVAGLGYMGDDVRAFGGHAWDEVVLDGRWVPVDPTWNEVEADAAHVAIDRDHVGGGFLSAFGRVQFRLKDVQRRK